MKLQDMIADLRSKGYVVQITHYRCRNTDVNDALERRLDPNGDARAHPTTYFPQTTFPNVPTKALSMSPLAGRTIARVGRKQEEGIDPVNVAMGESRCSPLDVYVRYTGAVKALGRAVSNLEARHGA